MSELSKKFSKLTGLNYDIDNLINNATTAEQKKVLYDKLMWDIKNGLIRGVDGIKELVQFVLPKLAEALSQPSTAEVVESDPTKYTKDEADSYNMQHNPDSWPYNKQIKPSKEECNAYNQEHFENYGQEAGPWAYDTQIKTPAVSEELYTEESAAAYNATLIGALQANVALQAEQVEAYNTAITGASKAEGDTLTTEEATLYNSTLEGAVEVGAVKTAGKDAEYYIDYAVTAHNESIEGAYTVNKVLGIYTKEQVDEHNADWDGAVHAGDTKPTQTNDNQEQGNQEQGNQEG